MSSLLDVFLGAVAQMDPTKLVKAKVRAGKLDDWLGDLERPRKLHVIAIGKAAPTMLWGLVECSVPFAGVGIVPHGVKVPLVDTFTWYRGNHPTPGPDTHLATNAILRWIDALPSEAHVLVLLSGGASSLLETEAGTRADWDAWLRRDWNVQAMNRARSEHSEVKAGRLATRILARVEKLQAWVLSDIGEHIREVGSGPVNLPEVAHILVGRDTDLREAAARVSGPCKFVDISGPMEAAMQKFISYANPTDVLIGVGEPELAVPIDAPPGGRAHHAALLAKKYVPPESFFLAGGSDGDDGGVGTGAIVRGGQWDSAHETALQGFAAAQFLQSTGESFDIGPTGCNLNDVWLLSPTPKN